MNWEQIKQDWRFVSQRVMLTWGKLSEDDLVFIGGDRGRFVDLYSQRYGCDGSAAILRVDDFARGLALPPHPATLIGRAGR
ncbi:hypothetical protein [Botrimarina sp.]|uniref:hypothetical protein n=1 Tax=Botrimarina sp. TaxID=2795802 RepID=UPI0032F09153